MKKSMKVSVSVLLLLIMAYLGGFFTQQLLKPDLISKVKLPGASNNSRVSEKEIAARKLLDKSVENWSLLYSFDKQEISKRLNYFVYNYCSTDTPFTDLDNINQLFEECRSACGGFTYVLQGLLDLFDINNRHTALYNIPQQGNHSLVETEIAPDRWALFDPTFGIFFTRTGRIDEIPLSMDDLQYYLRGKDLNKYVIQAKRGSLSRAIDDLEKIYQHGDFFHQYMSIENYHLAEQFGYDSQSMVLPLSVSLDVSSGQNKFGVFKEAGLRTAEQTFLAITNDTLNDNDPKNDVSYNFSYLGYAKREYSNIIFVQGLKKKESYAISLRFYNPYFDKTQIQVMQVGGNIVFSNNSSIPVDCGNSKKTLHFKAISENGIIIIRLLAPKKRVIRLFGIMIERVE
jgi:hypothetical protein